MNNEFTNLSKSHEEIKTKLDKIENEKNDLVKSHEKLNVEHKETSTKLQNVEEENKKITAKYESELKKLQDKLKNCVPKSDLDDLMLLMSDLDEKNKAYKSRLKKLGDEVSSDEESEEEESEDDDE